MEKTDTDIDAVRLRTNEAERELLGDDLLGVLSATQCEKDDMLGRRSFFRLPVRFFSFGGAPRPFPVFKTTMVFTALTTAFLLATIYPPAPQASVDGQVLAMLPRAGTQSQHPPLTPLQARVKRLQELHETIKNEETTHTAAPQEEAQPDEHQASSMMPAEILDAPVPLPEAVAESGKRSDNKQGIYFTASSVARKPFFWSTLHDLQEAGGDAVIFDVKGSGVLYRSTAPMATEIGLVKSIYDLPPVIEALHASGAYVIGRFVAIKDDALTTKLPETRIMSPSGKVLSYTWVDPSNDKAIEFNMQVVCELAAAGIDEINLDYIRFSTADFGALRIYSGQEKADRVEKFIRATRETIDRCGPNTKLGLSTYAILGWSYDINVATLGQDVRRFAPFVDVISPMAYPATFTSPAYYIPGKHPGPRAYWLVYRTLTGYATLLGPEHEHKIRPWIQGYSVSAKDVSDQIRAVYDAGYCGFTVWNARKSYSQTLSAMSKDTLKPERCLGNVFPPRPVQEEPTHE